MLSIISQDINFPDGRVLTLETGHVARQADGSVILRCGKTMIFASVVASEEPREDVNFLPLSVDYQEQFSSGGRIPGGFIKRESRLNEREILISRLIDRAIRPLFPDNYYCETQVIVNLISFDEDVLPDSLAALAASAALYISDIPFDEPISEVRVIRQGDEFMINPSLQDIENADIELIVGATQDNILMVEGEMKEVQESEMIEAIKVAHDAIKLHCEGLRAFKEKINKPNTKVFKLLEDDLNLKKTVHERLYDKIKDVAGQNISDKNERKAAFKAVFEPFFEEFANNEDINTRLLGKYVKEVEKKAVREVIFDSENRLDGRKPQNIRDIDIKVDFLPSTHGSALFTRGETQALTTVTLGGKDDEQIIDTPTSKGVRNFYLHYNFPGFATGEVKPRRGATRREVGHGNLAYRALKNILPSKNAYTIRIVSDILESNGSSSMATVCAGCLALMDSGIKIKAAVSGIAMGLVYDENTGQNVILSDILGDEDHLGDMDFKVTGTKNGITACQMDIKVKGLPYDILDRALEQAKDGRLHILKKMNAAIDSPRSDLKPHIPRVEKLIIDKSLIGAVIGQGGKVIQKIQEVSGATISIEEKDNQGHVSICSSDKDKMKEALEMIKNIVEMPKVGELYEGTVKTVTDFGAFVEFFRNKEGLLHVSEIAKFHVSEVSSIVNVGDTLTVELLSIQDGKYRLSCKNTMAFEKPPETTRRRYNDNNSSGGNRRRPNRGGGDRGGGGGGSYPRKRY